jgi:nucleoside-diphosphate-sugar epimerase
MRTAILGATGYIGESLGRLWAQDPAADLTLFARAPERLHGFPDGVRIAPAEAFDAAEFDLVINGVGAGDPARVGALGAEILDISRTWEARVMDRLRPEARYVFLSSGVVHAPPPFPPYTISKREAEAQHRAIADKAIVDIRVFAYAETNIKLDGAFFLAELARSVIRKQPFRTTRADMMRDYAGAPELKALIDAWMAAGAPNCGLDLYTRAPVSKLQLLEFAQSELGLDIDWIDSVQEAPTGQKPGYVSSDHAAEKLGYRPGRNAFEVASTMLKVVTRQG